MTTGHCNCSAVQVEVPLETLPLVICSCTSCRASSGSLFTVNLIVPSSAFTLLKGEENLGKYEDKKTDSGGTAIRYWCKTCGSPVYTVFSADSNTFYVKGGLFPPKSLPKPVGEIFTRNFEEWQIKHVEEGKCAEGGPGGA
ncbi:hypothetical protein JCM11641_004242 [Rhodosporidiobolus odoratus]